MYGLRGIGDTPGAFSTACGGGLDALNPSCWGTIWGSMTGSTAPASSVAPPPAPTGAALTTPPASEADAAALVQSIANQQAVAQRALNAGQVQSSISDTVLGGASSATTAVTDAVTDPFSSWWLIGALAISFVILANLAKTEGVR
jgi:hypothetical protein